MDFGLKGKNLVLGGATGGIGGGLLQLAAAQGLNILFTGTNQGSLNKLLKGLKIDFPDQKFLGIPADASKPTEIKSLIDQGLDSFGQIDILFHNGFGPGEGEFQTCNRDKWIEAFEKTFLALTEYLNLLLPHFKAKGGGSVVHISSTVVRQSNPFYTTSTAIFSATSSLISVCAEQYAPFNINLNSICPAFTETEKVRWQMGLMAKKKGVSLKEIEKEIAEQIPAGRLIQPSEIAHLALFLATPSARMITGAKIPLDGGYIKSMDK